jgi:hypothetical protein
MTKTNNRKTIARYKTLGLGGSYGGATAFSRALGGRPVKEDLLGEESYTLHRPVRYRFPRRKTIVSGPGDEFQCDLVDCSAYKKYNDGIRYLFCCIDVFSKYAWVRPLHTKRGQETTAALTSILKKVQQIPLALQTDKGTEMKAAPFQKVLKQHGINYFTTENDDIKASIVERFQRTLQKMIHRHMTASRSHAFVDVLPLLVNTYNATHHSAIGMAPRDVSYQNTEVIWQKLYSRDKKRDSRPSHDVVGPGDYVRISKTRRQFAKGYTGHWSREIFMVSEALDTTPPTYRIADMNGDELKGSFYGPELQQISPPDYYDVEEILTSRTRRGRKEYLVKWAGYPTTFNSWETDLIKTT